MSKLTDKLEGVEQRFPSPMGFGAAGRHKSAPPIILVGHVTSDELKKSPGLAEAPVDAFLVTVDSCTDRVIAGVAKVAGDRVWGIQSKRLEVEQLGTLKKKGCDFIAFEAEGTPAGILSDENFGKVIAVGSGLGEDAGRAIQELPIDAALFTPEEELLPLTVQRLIEIQLVRGLVDKPFVMASQIPLGKEELEALRNAGVSGLLVGLSSPDSVASTKEAIDDLPRLKSHEGRLTPVVPNNPDEAAPHIHEEEEDEEEGL